MSDQAPCFWQENVRAKQQWRCLYVHIFIMNFMQNVFECSYLCICIWIWGMRKNKCVHSVLQCWNLMNYYFSRPKPTGQMCQHGRSILWVWITQPTSSNKKKCLKIRLLFLPIIWFSNKILWESFRLWLLTHLSIFIKSLNSYFLN